ncbi:hypothetical protein LK07_15800 [Streptomyces pluripotens]|uniref:Uncharacterized protein n=1 Tax=Streptomyces pluripotens TaxID=1355015 RepID=A0A221NZK0_9ACTN|nr:hypothetical protein LK06_014670 [Streptomyces pluripotens]ASN25246.1 hypothetical protein LK07_15800 [Streptomyces pluripotens]
MPSGAHDTHCTAETWLDTLSHHATFRIPRRGAQDGLKSTCPHASEPNTEYSRRSRTRSTAAKGWISVWTRTARATRGPSRAESQDRALVDVPYEGPVLALVRLSTFTE